MKELHVNDLCPRCDSGIMLGDSLIGGRNALVLKCDRCNFRHAIPPGPINSAELARWTRESKGA